MNSASLAFCCLLSVWSHPELYVFGSYLLALRGVTLNGGPGGPRDLGKMSTHIISRPWWTQPAASQEAQITAETTGWERACYLLYVGLQRAVKRSDLHMLGYQAHFPQDVKGQPLLEWTEVSLGHVSVIWNTRKFGFRKVNRRNWGRTNSLFTLTGLCVSTKAGIFQEKWNYECLRSMSRVYDR